MQVIRSEIQRFFVISHLETHQIQNSTEMTKAEIASEIAKTTGIDKAEVVTVIEQFMTVVKIVSHTARTYISVASVLSSSRPVLRKQPATSARTPHSLFRLTIYPLSNSLTASRKKSPSKWTKAKTTISSSQYLVVDCQVKCIKSL